MNRPKRVRLPRKAREAARFTAASALAFDLLLVGFSHWGPTASTRSQFVSLLPRWDLVKGAAIVLGMLVVARRARSWLLGIFAIVLALVVVLEEVTGYALAVRVLVELGVDPDALVDGVPAFLYAELYVLGALALFSAVAIWILRSPTPPLKTVRRHLFLLLTVLCYFAVGVGFVAEFWNSAAWKLIEESGEMVVLSLLLGYVVGLLVEPPSERSWYRG